MSSQRISSKSSSPLSSTTLDVLITDLVAEYTVRHRFENKCDESIEAVFTFPVPLDAVFLGMKATLAGETLLAKIHARQKAARMYDDAIADGNSGVLLSAPEPGVLNILLGNLKPHECGDIELKFATMLRVADRSARFSLPFVHRPRYGKWRLEDLETPTHDFAIEHPMSATIRVTGLLASAPVTCVTHAARFAHTCDTSELTIPQAMLDRDLVLSFELEQGLAPTGHLIADGEASLGMASFVLPMRDELPNPLDLCLVLDCSGSMTGDAIGQSRRAMGAIIDALGELDRIQVLRFGSTVVPMLHRPLMATSRVRESLRELVQTVNADLGGTEIGNALGVALKQLGPSEENRARAIILVTDGAVQPNGLINAQSAAKESGVRIFVVAVGSSAGAEVLGPVAEATGGVLERAVPAEPIDVGVMRQFRRARETGPVQLRVSWLGCDAISIPMGVAYPGDAASVSARLPGNNGGEAIIEAPTLDFTLHVPLGAQVKAPALRALLGQQLYRLANADKREALAQRYELLTTETSAVIVKLRAENEKGESLPVIMPVQQMTPQGMVTNEHSYLHVACCVEEPVMCMSHASTDWRLPIVYKPSEREPYMNAKQLDYFRQRLVSICEMLKLRYFTKLRAMQPTEGLIEIILMAFECPKHSAPGTERSWKYAIIEMMDEKISAALKRIDDGTYGYCIDTGAKIGLKRLEAHPAAERTLEAQKRWEDSLTATT